MKIKKLLILCTLGAAALIILDSCGPSEGDCQKLCDWWAAYCTAEPRQSCVDDCMDSNQDDVDYAMGQCLDFQASSCKGASCCLRFVYTEYYFTNNCL